MAHAARRPKRLLGLLLCALAVLATGCRFTQLIYNNAEWLVLHEADKTICPDPEQRAVLKRAVRDLLAWHRRSELPRYATLLRQLARDLEKPVTRELMRSTATALEQAWQRAVRQAERPMVSFGLSLGKRQASCLGLALAKSQREDLVKQHTSGRSYQAQRRKEVVDRIEPWIGELSESQLDLLSRVLPAQDEAMAVSRARINKGLRLASALTASNQEKKRAWLRSWLSDPYALYTREERMLVKRQSDRNQERVWQFAQTLSATQRSRLSKRLADYATDFEALARQ